MKNQKKNEMAIRLEKTEARALIIKALLTVHEQKDVLFDILKTAEDTNQIQEELMKRFSFNEMQARDVAAMRICFLTASDKKKLEAEYAYLVSVMNEYKQALHEQ